MISEEGFAPFSLSSTVRFWGGSGLPWRVRGEQGSPTQAPRQALAGLRGP